MTEAERIAHLSRKMGFGGTRVSGNVTQATRYFLDFEGAAEPTWPSRAEIFTNLDGTLDTAGGPVQRYWVARMLLTERPLQEKIALFWHSWFAVSRGKVGLGPVLLDYLETLRTKGLGRFGDLLESVALGPAMMLYLDLDQSIKGRPNENLARELLELFSLGIGNYSESDVLETTRALTGCGVIVSWRGLGKTDRERHDRYLQGEPPAYTYYSSDAHDDRPQTILGKTQDRTPTELVRELAAHPATRKRVCEKLWTFFVREDAPPAAVRSMEQAYTRTDGDIREVLRAMVATGEFWEPASVRSQPSSPADFTIGAFRSLGIAERLSGLEQEPVPDLARRVFGVVHQRMARQGLDLLAPEDVSGWKWGRSWFTPAAMTTRFSLKPLSVFGPRYDRPWCAALQKRLVASNPDSDRDAAQWLTTLTEAPPDPALVDGVAKLAAGRGLENILQKTDPFLLWLEASLQLIAASPRIHLI